MSARLVAFALFSNSDKSMANMIKRIGPNVDPWDTSLFRNLKTFSVLSSFTFGFLLSRKMTKHP